MESIYLFDFASRHTRWLSARQVAIAGNIANVDTPGYRAQDVKPFAETLQSTQLDLAATAPGHIRESRGAVDEIEAVNRRGWAVKESGNSVTVEEELLKAGEVSRAFSLDTAVLRSFHRMLMTSVNQ